MKVCSSCNAEYEPYGQRCALCPECRRAYDREYHAKRSAEKKQKKYDQQVALRTQNSQYVYNYLKSNPCVTCGETRIPCLQFDHLDGSAKEANVAQMTRSNSLEKIIAEIAKCQVLCANCHAMKTAEDFNWYSRLEK